MKKALAFVPATLFLFSCVPAALPPEAYNNHSDPESLIDVSSEVVSISLETPKAGEEILGWLKHEQPVRAELSCEKAGGTCRQALKLLNQFGVKYAEKTGGQENNLDLMYERVVARDCDHRYTDNHINPHGLNYSAFGCSVKANMVQSVTQKRQFVDPALMDYADGEKAAVAYQKYLVPGAEQESKESLLKAQ